MPGPASRARRTPAAETRRGRGRAAGRRGRVVRGRPGRGDTRGVKPPGVWGRGAARHEARGQEWPATDRTHALPHADVATCPLTARRSVLDAGTSPESSRLAPELEDMEDSVPYHPTRLFCYQIRQFGFAFR